MRKGQIFLGCPHCEAKTLKSKLCRGKWKPFKIVNCPECESPSELSEWTWYQVGMVLGFKEMTMDELKEFTQRETKERTNK